MIEDIPEATREAIVKPTTKISSGFPVTQLIAGGLVIAAIAGGSLWLLNRPRNSVSLDSQATSEKVAPAPAVSEETAPVPPKEEPVVAKPEPEPVENILGHLPYEQASENDLVAMTADGRIKLHKTAAEKFRQMEADAKAQGINLALISGFRSLDAQDSLFFEIKEQRVQPASQRAEVSAPPGYSEHHTGYAIDLGDANVPATHLSPKFEQTAAFKWLAQNAAKYSFELSFPRGNPQGISYEPWHWRFVGDRDSLETFYKAKNLQSKEQGTGSKD